MVGKFAFFVALVSAVSAADITNFSYDVADPYTGDFKSQTESRAGNDVLGQYSLLESDGTRRTVDYAAGAEGFNAIVRKDPTLFAAPIAVAAPPFQLTYATPFAYNNFAKSGAFPYAAPFPYARIL